MIDEKTIKSFENIIRNSECSATKAFLRLKKAVNNGDKDAVVEAYEEWQLFESYVTTQATTLEMLKDGVGF